MRAIWKSWGARRFELWLAAALAINIISMRIAAHYPRPIAYGAAFDVAVTVPALYFWMVVRAGIRSLATLIPLCLLAFWRATYVAPGPVGLRPLLAAAADAAVMGFLVVRVRRGLRAGGQGEDILETFEKVARDILPVGVAGFVAAELAMFCYALAWRMRPHVPPGMRAFSSAQRGNAALVFAALAVLTLMETPVVHFVILHWSVKAAWIVTVLDLYAALWMVAIARSFGRRPTLVGNGYLEIRHGVLLALRVPLAQVAAVRLGVENGCPRLPLAGDPNVTIEFTEPVEARRLYGRYRPITRVALALDASQGFVDALRVP